MGYTAYFERGANRLYIDGTGRYSLATDFVPPLQTLDIYTAGGTSANLYAGAERIGEKAGNRDFTFGIRLLGATAGTSGTQLQAALDGLNRFLQDAGDENNPTYFVWRGDNDLSFDPMWGQQARRLEVVSGRAGWGQNFGIATLREIGLNNCPVVLQVKPFALGQAQVLANAKGGMIEDYLGMLDGQTRGTIIPPACTNECTNPVFGNATYTTNWTTGAGILASKNIDADYVYPGASASAKLTAIAAINNYFYFSVNAGNTNGRAFSAYVRKADGSAITNSEVGIYYNADLTTVVRHVGNGVYVATATAAGINASANCGLKVFNGVTVFLMGFQMETGSYSTPLAWGDLLNCAWASTVHASSTTRTAAACSIPVANSLNMAEGSVVIVWRPDISSTDLGNGYQFCNVAATGLRALYNGSSDDKFYLQDGTNSISTAAQTWAAGDVLHLVFTWKSGTGLNIYKNGANAATGATYTPAAYTGSMFIGSTEGTTFHTGGTYMRFDAYDRALTSTQVAAIYAHDLPLITEGKRCGAIPWVWSLAGAGVVYSMDDSTHKNYVVCGGVPGTVEADTTLRITSASWDVADTFIGNHIDPTFWRNPATYFYKEGSGSAQAGNSNADYLAVAYPLTPFASDAIQKKSYEMTGNVYCFSRMRSESGTASIVAYGALQTTDGGFLTPPVTCALTTSYSTYHLGSVRLPRVSMDTENFDVIFRNYYDQATAAFRLDFDMWFEGDLVKITPVLATAGGGITTQPTVLVLRGKRAGFVGTVASGVANYIANRIGDEIALRPSAYNTVKTLIEQGSDLTKTVTFSRITIIPRWSIA